MSHPSRLARLRNRFHKNANQALRRRRLIAGFEPLEDRRLMAIDTTFAAGVLTFTGDFGGVSDDQVVLQSTATPGTINYDDGSGLGSTTQAGVNSVVFSGASGENELIIINQGLTAFRPFAGASFDIQFNVAGDPDLDVLRIAGGDTTTILGGSYTVSSPTAGTISYTTGNEPINISFSGLDSSGPDRVDDTTIQSGDFTTNTSTGAENVKVEVGPNLPPVQGFVQGPVFIDGGDRDDHGSFVSTPSRWTIGGFQDLEGGGWNLGANGNIANATTRPHVSITGTGDGTSDFYRFHVATAGSLGTFDIDATTGGPDSRIALFDSAGNVLFDQDDNGGDPGSSSGLDSRFDDFAFPSVGDYFIGVNRFAGGAAVSQGFPSTSGVDAGTTYTLHVSVQNHALVAGVDPIAEVEPNELFVPPGAGANQDGWLFIEQALRFVYDSKVAAFGPVSGLGTKNVLVIGMTGGQAQAAFTSAASLATPGGLTFDIATGAAISTAIFSNYDLIYVPADVGDTTGGISNANLALLTARKADVQAFIRSGGGLVALTEGTAAAPYAWLELPALFTITSFGSGGISNALRKTPEAIAAGFTISDADLSDGVPYHNVFTGPAGFNGLDIFVLDTGPNDVVDAFPPGGDDRAVTLGQGAINVTVGGGLTTTISGNQMTLINLGDRDLLELDARGGTDAITVDGTVMSLDGLISPLAIAGGGNGDSLLIDDSADNVGGDAVSVTSLATTGLAAFPISYAGIGPLSVRATQGADTLTLDFSAAGPSSVHIFGGLSGDTFTGPTAYMQPTAAIPISVHGGVLAAPAAPFNPFGEVVDKFNLDMTTRASGGAVLPIVIVDTNGGNAVSANTALVRFTGIEDIDVKDDGLLTNTEIGDFYLRATGNADYIEFRSAAQVNPVFRVRVGNVYYPSNTGNFGPYTTGSSQVYVYGREGNDTVTMYNTRLNAVIFGEEGDDVLTGGYGDDLLIGGQGNDRLNGAVVGGNDEIWGDYFDPVLDDPAVASQAAGGNDQINTSGGADTVYGQGGNDIINTGGGDDYVNGGLGIDFIDGQAGHDRLYGGGDNDTINGSDGNDLVAGNGGNDTLNGRTGNDILIGGLGQDIVSGHEGQDAIVGDESNGLGSGSLAKNDVVDAALLALLLAWGPAPSLAALGGFGSSGADGSVDTLWGGAAADAFFGAPPDTIGDHNAPGYGPDLN